MKISALRVICQAEKFKSPPRHFAYNIHRIWSIYITKILINLNVSANTVTMFAILTGLASIGLISHNCFKLGILTYYFSFLLDKSDGELARYYQNVTPKGIYLDEIYHFIINPSIFLGIGIALFTSNQDIHLLLVGICTSYLTLLYRAIYKINYTIIVKNKTQAVIVGKNNFYYKIFSMASIEDIAVYLFIICWQLNCLNNLLYTYLIYYLVMILIEIKFCIISYNNKK